MDGAPSRSSPRTTLVLAALLALLLVVHVVVAFAPFRFDPPRSVSNGATLDDGFLAVTGPAEAHTDDPPPWLDAVRHGEDLAVALEVRAADAVQDGPARILTVEADYTNADLVIGQDGDDLVVRVRRPGSQASGDPPILVRDVFASGGWHRIEVASDGGELTIAVDDGEPVIVEIGSDGLGRWNTAYDLALGDSVIGNRTWEGEMREVRAGTGGATVDYLSPGALEIPDDVWYSPSRLDDVIGVDSGLPIALAHFLSFLPVGALVAALCTRRRVLKGLLWSAAFAFFLQVGKVFFDTRHPALVDFVVEVAGGAVGAWCWMRLTPLSWSRARPGEPEMAQWSEKATMSA
jgi:hypothetical protein